MHFSVIFFENTILRKHFKKKIDSDVVFTEKRLRHMCLTVIFYKILQNILAKVLTSKLFPEKFPTSGIL